MNIFPLSGTDFYKCVHRSQYPPGTTLVYSNLTPRSAKLTAIPPHLFDGTVVCFGLQFFIRDFLIDCWNQEFFWKDKGAVVGRYKRRLDTSLGKDSVAVDHIEALHDLGYLPISNRAIPEGNRVPIRVPVLTIHNTHPDFFWLTNYLETALSAYLWKPMTSATDARAYRRLFDHYAERTCDDDSHVKFQGHDFSFRGMSGLHDGALCGAAHLTSFVGTDTIAAIDLIEQYYGGDAQVELIGCSVPASEHSVVCMGGQDDEIGTFRRMITEVYPSGIVSMVSDTWDFFRIVTDGAAILKPEIMARNGKLVFRPDSGDPVKIICGDPEATHGSPEWHGAFECLWQTFGGSINSKGYRVLDPHVGLIYGDSITLKRAEAILQLLTENKAAASNIVFGIGSFSRQYVTRDSLGFAVKSTAGAVDFVLREIYKEPKTDGGTKKSARGFLKVAGENGAYELMDRQPFVNMPDDAMEEVFRDGRLLVETTIAEIRARLSSS